MLKKTCNSSLNSNQSAIKHMRISHIFTISVFCLQHSALIISTIWYRHQLSKSSLSRIPCLKIYFPYRCVIQLTRHNINKSIRNLKRLEKYFSITHHLLHHLLWLFRMTYDKLLYFLKLMESEQTLNIFPMSTCFPSIAWRISCHFLWQLLIF